MYIFEIFRYFKNALFSYVHHNYLPFSTTMGPKFCLSNNKTQDPVSYLQAPVKVSI